MYADYRVIDDFYVGTVGTGRRGESKKEEGIKENKGKMRRGEEAGGGVPTCIAAEGGRNF